ncbi:MAG: peptidoglycan-binding protein LysM [Pseudomonadota bacterium]
MGIFDFVGNAGKKLFAGGEIDENAVLKHLASLGLNIQALSVIAHQDKKMISIVGRAATIEDKEKLILAAGNVDGVEKVDDRVRVVEAAAQPLPEAEEAVTEIEQAPEPTPEEAPSSTFYTVQSGDTLSGIAKEHYGNAGKYMVIFEANQPMLEDPNKIYPGQVLRIPAID